MLRWALCMLGGAYALICFSQLPPSILFVGSILLACGSWRFGRWRPPAAFLLGFGMMGLSAQAQLSNRLGAEFEAGPVAFSALIEDFPVTEPGSVRFVVRPVERDDLPQRIRLSWFEPGTLPGIGETWRLTARLKRPRGYSNPAGFDFEGWLFQQKIGATGYLTGNTGNYRIHGETPGAVSRLRARFVARTGAGLPQDDATAVLMAIGVGARHAISRDQWDLYARTGTSHLMAISGLHIGLAASFAYLLCRAVCAPFCRKLSMRDLATNGAIITAIGYAALSGFAVPAKRAVLMAIVAGGMVLLRRRMDVAGLLAIPCLFIFSTDPVAILSPGFKLSFAAVAILIFVTRQHSHCVVSRHWRRSAGIVAGIVRLSRLQVALLTGLFPLTVLVFDRFALVAPVVNLLVLPVFNFVTVPLALVGAIMDGPFEAAGFVLLKGAYHSIRGILWLVAVAGSAAPGSFHIQYLGLMLSLITLISLLFILLPPGWPGRKLALICVLSVLAYRTRELPEACIDYHVLDVGQGLAVLVQTRRHALLFDTGPAFLNGGSAAQLVVVPFLQSRGIERLDKLFVSHADLDHAGGVAPILASIDVVELVVGELLPDVIRQQRHCVAGDQWRWDAAELTILHPRNGAPWGRNNSSCVLQVAVGDFSLMLTGDIEAPAEKILLHRQSVRETDVIVVPHHGSLTSSSGPFIEATRPGHAIVSAGFRNRWRFPRPEVVARWHSAGATVLNTATMGAISQRVCRGTSPAPVRLNRLQSRKYWHEAPGRP